MDKPATATMTPEEFLQFRRALDPEAAAPSEEEQSPRPRLDQTALYGLPGEIVRAIEPHSEGDPAALLAETLTAFGNVIGRNAYYQVEADRHYPNLYCTLVGPTSKGRKGTTHGQVMAQFRSVDELWVTECVKSGLSSGEGLIWNVRDAIHKQEPVKEKGRVTHYQDVETDPGVVDKRLLVIEPEFASTLRVLSRDGNTLSAVLRNGWDSGNLRVLTKNSPANATGAHISLIGHITEDELRRELNSTEAGNGFANRFLWVYVARSKCLPDGGEIWKVDFRSIVHRLHQAVDFSRNSDRIRFDETAAQTWRGVYPELSEGHAGLFGAITGRAEAQTVRLALIYALMDRAESIRQEHLLAALALWEYCEASARYVFGDALGDPVADEILAAFKRNPGGLTRTQISNLFNRNRSAREIGHALGVLMREGKVKTETVETDGRSAEVWSCITDGAKEAKATNETN